MAKNMLRLLLGQSEERYLVSGQLRASSHEADSYGQHTGLAYTSRLVAGIICILAIWEPLSVPCVPLEISYLCGPAIDARLG